MRLARRLSYFTSLQRRVYAGARGDRRGEGGLMERDWLTGNGGEVINYTQTQMRMFDVILYEARVSASLRPRLHPEPVMNNPMWIE